VATLPKLDPVAVAEVGGRLRDNIQRAVKVRDEVVRDVLVALLAEGHMLIEDYPGVGKTALARALARSVDAEYARVQCTVDLLPADVIGTNVFRGRGGSSSIPGRSSRTWCSSTRSIAPRPRPSPGCWSACRNGT
jgi:MoxR-like ATPase